MVKFKILLIAIIIIFLGLGIFVFIKSDNEKQELTYDFPSCKKDCSYSIGYFFIKESFDDSEGSPAYVKIQGYTGELITGDPPYTPTTFPHAKLVGEKIVNKENLEEKNIHGKFDSKKCDFIFVSSENVSGGVARTCESFFFIR